MHCAVKVSDTHTSKRLPDDTSEPQPFTLLITQNTRMGFRGGLQVKQIKGFLVLLLTGACGSIPFSLKPLIPLSALM